VEMKSGSISKGENIAVEMSVTSGTTPPLPFADVAVPIPGLTYDVTVKGMFAPEQWTPPSQAVQFTSPKNMGQGRGFLAWSGVNGSKGIRQLTTIATSLRGIMGV
jgi:hypothetical protein